MKRTVPDSVSRAACTARTFGQREFVAGVVGLPGMLLFERSVCRSRPPGPTNVRAASVPPAIVTAMPPTPSVFGEIEPHAPDARFDSRKGIRNAGLHRHEQAGLSRPEICTWSHRELRGSDLALGHKSVLYAATGRTHLLNSPASLRDHVRCRHGYQNRNHGR
jgi:hypothetical protein